MALPIAGLVSVGGFLKNNWKLVGGAIIIGLLWWYINSLQNQRDHWHTEYVNSQKDLALATANIETLKTSIDEQNDAIDRMNDDLKNKERQLADREKERDSLMRKHQQELEDILNEEVPQTCQATIDYLVDGVEDLR